MKRWIALLAVLFSIVLLGGGAPPPCWGTPLITFTDTSNTWLAGHLSDSIVWYASWTQTLPTTDTAIGAIVSAAETGLGDGTAWLTNAIGPGTTSANVIASDTFTAPVISVSDWGDLTSAPVTNLFSGLSLDPGTYYLVLQGPGSGTWTNPYEWLGDWTGVVVTTASGFTVDGYKVTENAASFPPSSSFTGTLLEGQYLFYSVEGTVVPAPASLLLLASGLALLAGWRGRLKQ